MCTTDGVCYVSTAGVLSTVHQCIHAGRGIHLWMLGAVVLVVLSKESDAGMHRVIGVLSTMSY